MARRSAGSRHRSTLTEPRPTRQRDGRAGVLAVLAIVVVGILVHANSVGGVFLLDDGPSIIRNPDIRADVPLLRSTVPPTPAPGKGRWRGPIVALTLAINYRLSGLNPRSYHVLNICVHVLAALLVFGLVRRTLLLDSLRDRFGRAAGVLALVTSLIWLVHPLVTDAVTYVIQRAESIMALFYLLTLYCFVRGCVSERPRGWFACTIGACALGMVSKEVMVTAPIVVLLYDRTLISGSFAAAIRRRWRVYVGLAATWLALAWLMISSPHPGVIGFGLEVGPWDYAKAQCLMLIQYLWRVFVPTRLVLDYGVAGPVPLSDAIVPGAIVLVLLLVAIVSLWRRRPMGFALASVFLILAPTSSFIPILKEVGAERRMYLPLVAIVAMVVAGAYRLLDRFVLRRFAESRRKTTGMVAGGIVTLAVVAPLGILTVRRNAQFHHAETIWRDTVAKRPDNYRAHFYLGLALKGEDQPEEAIAEYHRALELNPDYYRTHYNMANALRTLGRDDEAIRHFRMAIEANPGYAEAHTNLGNALLDQERFTEAIAHYTQALKIDPQLSAARENLRIAKAHKAKAMELLDKFEEEARLTPDSAVALGKLAWILATHPDESMRDTERAVILAERAATLSQYQHVGILDALAAAYASAGRYEDAVAIASDAIELADSIGRDDAAIQIRKRLAFYREHRPYRGPVQVED